MSEIKVNKLSPRSGTDVALGDSGDSFNVPSGAAIAVTGDLKSSILKDSTGAVVISKSGTAVTIGASGDTVSVASGATLEGAGLAWQSVQTTGFTASAGNAYACNTTSAGFTITLPASASVGDQIAIVDYAGTFDTNNLTINPNGLNMEGSTSSKKLQTEREGVTITYVDATQGWVASSGVNSGTQALDPIIYLADFLVVAGGGGGGTGVGGGGGGGGFRTASSQTLNGGTVYTITVGDGGASGVSGSNSSISGSGLTTITSAGGGRGGSIGGAGSAGGSGGGGAGFPSSFAGGSGNTPSTSPSQGNNGGSGKSGGSPYLGGGGGGASGSGTNASGSTPPSGGSGTASSITGSSVTYAGGGGGCSQDEGTAGPGGSGGGGKGGWNLPTGTSGVDGTINLGGGGGGGRDNGAGAGGKGVVILSVPDASYSGTTTGSPTIATGVSGQTILTFTGTGSYTG